MRASSATIATAVSRSCGNTSWNQPTHPAAASSAPSALTDALVRRPANSSVHPNASTIGQAVGAGTSILVISSPQRPMTYTTVNTTTQTTSTKCQYIEMTSTRVI